MTRLRAFHWRLAATVCVLLVFVAVVRLLWYPGGYASLAGVGKFLAITAAVNLIIGPGLSTLVYKPAKPGLMLDLSVLAAVELIVLGWSLAVIHERRPMYTVFAVDRFEVVTAAEIDRDEISYPELQGRTALEPRLVYAELPKDPKIHEQLLDDVLLHGLADIDRRPEFWKPYSVGIPLLQARARPLADLINAGDERSQHVQRWLTDRAIHARDYRFLPMRGRYRDAAMILRADNGFPVDILRIDPW